MNKYIDPNEIAIAVVGLGYVGLPLAYEFAKKRSVIGFDISKDRVDALKEGIDKTLEISKEELLSATKLLLTSNERDLSGVNCYIIAVPTPVDAFNCPNLDPLKSASEMVGRFLKRGDLVIYESTVYPGATEEFCVPILEACSGLTFNEDFYCGYSPERINPGDKLHKIHSVKKITSGSTPEAAELVDRIYSEIIIAGTHKASSIKIAEAAKIIENTQRDVNIALINELAIIFSKLQIDTGEVLEAAKTKWNFLPFVPGLVGGHCIGVDPYYLTHKSISVGYSPQVILAGRRINDGMGTHVAQMLVKKMREIGVNSMSSKVLVMGFTFKENCPDIRNSKVIDVVLELENFGCNVDIYDPLVDQNDVFREFSRSTIKDIEGGKYDAIVLAVAHKMFVEMGIEKVRSYTKKNSIIYDLKHIFKKNEVEIRL